MTHYRTKEQLREERSRRYAAKDWPEIRLAVFKRDGFKCKTCGRSGKLRCHHTTYEHLWDEWNHLHELVTQCNDCHEQGTYGWDKIRRDRKAVFWRENAPKIVRFLGRWTWWLLKWTLKILALTPFVIVFVIIWMFGLILLLFAAPTWLKSLFQDVCEWGFSKLFRL